LWLISFYFAGIRVSDVLKLKWSDFHGGRLYYAMGKNHKGDSLLVSNKVEEILSQYETMREDGCDLIFPELRGVDLTDKFEAERKCASKIGIIDKWLRTEVKKVAKIEQPLTMHISRHTFGNISGDSIPVQMLQKLYRHTDIKTTIGYQSNFIHSDVDDALSAVMSRI
jgi:integrase